MSWATNKSNVTTVLNSAGYHEVEFNLRIATEGSTKDRNKGYTLKPTGVIVTDITSCGLLNTHLATLVIGYIANNNSEYDKAFDSFIDLLESLNNKIAGFNDNPTFERLDDNNKYIIATTNISVGI